MLQDDLKCWALCLTPVDRQGFSCVCDGQFSKFENLEGIWVFKSQEYAFTSKTIDKPD